MSNPMSKPDALDTTCCRLMIHLIERSRLIKREIVKRIPTSSHKSSSWREKCVHPVLRFVLFRYRFGVTVQTSVLTRDRISWGSNSHLHFPGGRPN
nr:hypothetical protein [Tanacetum cinerariifolium]